MQFSHLHCHTQFSLLDGAASIPNMIAKAKADNMPAVAMTDHGNMFGAFQFVAEASKQGIKPIVGCELYVVDDRHKKAFTKELKDKRYHQLLLAKNPEGYQNLTKLCSLGFIEGQYGKYPRVDKELIMQYHKGLIATTCCIGASVPQTILKFGEAAGEIEFKWWLDLFGDDYYVELQRHEIPEQIKVNEVLVKFAVKHNVKIIASNDSHYVDQKDANAHDILLCINTGEKQSTPTMKEFSDDDSSMKGKRFAFYNDQFYFKNTQEMSTLFADIPQAIDNTNEIVDKVETLKLKRDIMLPNFPIPDEFKLHTKSEFHKDSEMKPDVLNQWEFLKHLTYEGAKKRYGEISPATQERLDFELFTIKTMGFAGYFLIVMDFIEAGRNLGVFVGPGRGSAAGSVVAYCIGITNIDPIKYDLLFERFLNPDRKSMPDIDTDFDDEGRQKVIDYVVEKYGKRQVAAIVTYGTMAAKMSIKDVARVLDLPLDQSNGMAKLVPDKPGISLKRVLTANIEGEKGLKDKEGLQAEDIENVKLLREILAGTDLRANVLREALILEGSVRGTGVHAAGIIIAPSDLTDLIPVATAKDSDLLLTQFEGKIIEDAGVIKMDFLGLKTLTIIKNTLKLIKKNHGIDIVIDDVDLEDMKTYEVFQRGETNGIFQFESAGMQKHMKDLKPDRFGDIIAMNALYRPGPIAYIPNYIARKHGREDIVYDLPEMEEYLKDTHGITVYQEQVMLLSQKIGGFTKGDADVLRKAMGKKDRYTLDKMKSKFVEGAVAKGHAEETLNKIWTDWEAFAQYAFNKSHSTCYAFVAFQTAWLKAHYTAEYLAANLTNEKDNIEKVTYFLEECKKQNITVLGPSVNDSDVFFNVNKNNQILFGLGAIKGTGEAATIAIIEEREKNGPFKTIFDFAERVNLRTVNKKTFEALANAGGFDCFPELHRAQYFQTIDSKDNITALERIIRYGTAVQENKFSMHNSLFGADSEDTKIPTPAIPDCDPWEELVRLRIEKEVVGLYLSGHPLDMYKIELDTYCTASLDEVLATDKYKNQEVKVGGIISALNIRKNAKGDDWAIVTLQDFNGTLEMMLFSKDYINFKAYLSVSNFLYIRGKVQSKWKDENQMELKPLQMLLLSEIREKNTKCIHINLDLARVTNKTIETLTKTFTEHPGHCQVKVSLIDEAEKVAVEMTSVTMKVAPENQLIAELEKIAGLKYRLQ